jgi:type II secretory pathway pseudopilin PulG
MVSNMPISDRRGISLLVLTVAVILLATGLTVVIPRADLEVRRSREDDLRFKLGEFKRAVKKFVRCHERQPLNLDEMLQDASGNRFLRRAYLDPMTGRFDWAYGKNESGEFFVRSACDESSISGVPYSAFR